MKQRNTSSFALRAGTRSAIFRIRSRVDLRINEIIHLAVCAVEQLSSDDIMQLADKYALPPLPGRGGSSEATD